MDKTLQEYIDFYEKHTGEAFEFTQPFSFYYEPSHGFCEYKAEDTGIYIWQMCGDWKYWVDIAYKACQYMKLPAISAFIVRKPLPFIRLLGFRVKGTEDKDDCLRHHCFNKKGEKLTATQCGDRFMFVWEVKLDDD